LTALSFTALVHGLNALFGAIGKFAALILLVVQLVSAGGTFPWQTLPDALYPLHLILPMGYAVDGLRHLLYGGTLSGMPLDVGMLVLWGVIGLAMGVLAARRHRVWTADRLRPELAL
jgi:putative membrane protein